MNPKKPSNHYDLILLLLCAVGLNFIVGFSTMTVVHLLHHLGLNDTTIGYADSLFLLGQVVGSIQFLKQVESVPIRHIFLGSWAGLIASVIAVIVFSHSIPVLFTAFGIMGYVNVLILISMHTNIADLSSRASGGHGGTWTGLYVMSLGIGFTSGLIGFDILESWPFQMRYLLYLMIAIGLCIPGVMVGVIASHTRHFNLPKGMQKNWLTGAKLVWMCPLALGAVYVFASNDHVVKGLLPVYGEQIGLSSGHAALLMSMNFYGEMLLPPILGHLVDRLGALRSMTLYSLVMVMACGGFLLFWDVSLVTWAMVFLIGGLFGSFEGISFRILGQRYAGVLLPMTCAGVETCNSSLGLILSPIVGKAMDVYGPRGYSGSMVAINTFFFLCFLFFLIRQEFLNKKRI